jgi:predicted peroxiredoxin
MNRRALLLALATVLTPVAAFAQSSIPEVQSMKILVHITHGPEAPTRAALGFHVAKAALEAGHSVTMFLAGDAVQLVRPATRDRLAGLGTGELRGLFDALVAGGVSFYLSGGSSQARGLSEADLEGFSATFGSPTDLVRLAVEHDRMFTY